MNESSTIERQPTIEEQSRMWLNEELGSKEYFERWGEEAGLKAASEEADRWFDDPKTRPWIGPALGVDAHRWSHDEMDSDEYFIRARQRGHILAEREVLDQIAGKIAQRAAEILEERRVWAEKRRQKIANFFSRLFIIDL